MITFRGQTYALDDPLVLAALEPIQARWREIMDDPAYLDGVLDRGADQARQIASGVLAEVKQAMGLGR